MLMEGVASLRNSPIEVCFARHAALVGSARQVERNRDGQSASFRENENLH